MSGENLGRDPAFFYLGAFYTDNAHPWCQGRFSTDGGQTWTTSPVTDIGDDGLAPTPMPGPPAAIVQGRWGDTETVDSAWSDWTESCPWTA